MKFIKDNFRLLTTLVLFIEVEALILRSNIDVVTQFLMSLINWGLVAIINKESWYY